jgi:hypothetical protein
MPPLESHHIVDLVSEKDGEYELVVVVDKGEWSMPNAVWHLQEKLNCYATYILKGQMENEYGHRGEKILIYSIEPLPAKVVDFLEKAAPQFEKVGIGLEQMASPRPDAAERS